MDWTFIAKDQDQWYDVFEDCIEPSVSIKGREFIDYLSSC